MSLRVREFDALEVPQRVTVQPGGKVQVRLATQHAQDVQVNKCPNAQNPKPQTLNPKPQTLNPKP